MKIFITGHSGFVGSNICQKFSRTHDITKISLRDVNFNNTNDFENFLNRFSNADIVINCAASLKPKNKNDLFINENIPSLIARFLKKIKKNILFIHLSTINVLIKEREDTYTVSKRKAEEGLRDTKSVIIRLPFLYKEDDGKIQNSGNLNVLFKYLNINLPIYPMIYPGHVYEPLNINKFLTFLDQIIQNKYEDKIFINISGNEKKSLWSLFEMLAKEKNKRVFKINISNFIPNFLIKKLKKNNSFLQQFITIDNTRYDEDKKILN
jgi:nucleoside-diphosphate-sugar epimerase